MALIFPALLSSLVLAAHFLRWGNPPGVLAVLVLTVLALAARRKWSLKLLQGMLFASPFLWAFLAYRTAADRMLEGRPYARACLIFASPSSRSGRPSFSTSRRPGSEFGR